MMRTFLTSILLLSVSFCFPQKRQVGKVLSEIKQGQLENAAKNLDELEAKEGKSPEILFARYFLFKTSRRSTQELDSAYGSLQLAFNQLRQNDSKEQEKLCKELNFCMEQKEILFSELEVLIFDAYARVGSKSAWLDFQQKYPQAKEFNRSQWLIDSFDYADVKDSRELGILSAYVQSHQPSEFTQAAQGRIYSVAFEAAQQSGTKDELEQFIKKYPLSSYVKEAKTKLEVMAWGEAEKVNTASGYKNFAVSFPQSTFAVTALKRFDELSMNVLPFLTREKKYKLYDVITKQFRSSDSFDWISIIPGGKFIVKKYDKFGVIDKEGVPFIPITYNCISWESNHYVVKLGDKSALFTASGSKLIDFNYDFFNLRDSVILAFSLYGDADLKVCDVYQLDGTLRFSSNYSNLSWYSDTLFVASTPAQSFLVNGQGKVISQKYAAVYETSPGSFSISNGTMTGLMNTAGKVIIPLTYESIYHERSEGYFICQNKLGKSIVFKDGSLILPVQKKEIRDLGDGMFLLKTDLYDDEVADAQLFNANSKKFVTAANLSKVDNFNDGLALAIKNGKSGFINTSGDWIVNPMYDVDSDMFSDQYMDHEDMEDAVESSDECFLPLANLYALSNEVYPESYPLTFYNGLSLVKIGETYGYINKKGEVKIPIIYSSAGNFHNGYANVVLTEGEKNTNLVLDSTGKTFLTDAKIIYFFEKDTKALVEGTGKFSILDFNTKRLSLLTSDPELNYLTWQAGFFTSTYKGESVIVSEDGKILKDGSIDFSEYDLQQAINAIDSKYWSGDYDTAIEEYKSLLAGRPNNYLINYKIGLCYIKKDDAYSARTYLANAIKYKPKDVEDINPLSSLVELNFDKEYWSDVVRDITTYFLEGGDSNDRFLFLRAYAYQSLNKTDDALNDYTTLINNNPYSSTEYNNRGVIYMDKKLYQLALKDFEKAIQNSIQSDDQTIALYYRNKGGTLFNLNRKAEACVAWKKASSLGDSAAAGKVSMYCK